MYDFLFDNLLVLIFNKMVRAKSLNEGFMSIIFMYGHTHDFPRYFKVDAKVAFIVGFSFMHFILKIIISPK